MAEGALATAFVAIRPETTGFRSALTSQLRGDLKQTEQETGRFARGTALGSGALTGLGRAAVFASGTLLGGAGLAYGLKTVTKAATDHVALETQLQNAVQRSGLDYQQYATQIQGVIKAQEDLGFAEDVSTRSFTLALRATGSVVGAQRLLATSANVARGANKDLYSSTLILVRAYDGATTGLKRLGIQVDKGAKGFDAIGQVQKKYAGAAVAYADSAAGAQARLSVAIHETEIAIGTALLPTVTHLATAISDWLDKSKNQERIQNDVNTAVKDGTAIFHGFEGAVQTVTPLVKTLTGALGGLENTAKDLFLLFAAWKVGGIVSGLGKVTTATKIAGATAGEAGAAGEIGALTGSLGALSKIGPIAIPITIGLAIQERLDLSEVQERSRPVRTVPHRPARYREGVRQRTPRRVQLCFR